MHFNYGCASMIDGTIAVCQMSAGVVVLALANSTYDKGFLAYGMALILEEIAMKTY